MLFLLLLLCLDLVDTRRWSYGMGNFRCVKFMVTLTLGQELMGYLDFYCYLHLFVDNHYCEPCDALFNTFPTLLF
jgi:hypothetical protein